MRTWGLFRQVGLSVVSLFVASSCAVAPSTSNAATAAPGPTRWGDVKLVRLGPLGESMVVPDSTLHTNDNVAIYLVLRRPAFVHVVNIDPKGKVAFDSDLGRVLLVGEALRVPADPKGYFHLDAGIGTERVALLLSEDPLDAASVGALSNAVLLWDRALSARKPRAGAKVRGEKAAGPADQSPSTPRDDADAASGYAPLGADDRGADDRALGRVGPADAGPYVETEGGRRAATWIRFEHQP